MDATPLREMFEAVLPNKLIVDAIERLGVQKRKREADPVALVYSLILMGGTWESGRIATVMRDYFERGGSRVVASAYYRWFDDELLALMRELSAVALDYARKMPPHLPGILAGRRDSSPPASRGHHAPTSSATSRRRYNAGRAGPSRPPNEPVQADTNRAVPMQARAGAWWFEAGFASVGCARGAGAPAQ